jgi:uncharacterized protein YuzE
MNSNPASGNMTVTWSEMWIDGSSLTWDNEAKAGYLHVDPSPDAFAPTTIDIGHGIHVDVAEERIRGIERIGGPVDLETLLRVLRWCRWNPTPTEHIDGTSASNGPTSASEDK